MRLFRISLCAGMLSALCLSSGCGRAPNAVAVAGTVKLDGQPIDGAISFHPSTSAGASAGSPILAGTYAIGDGAGLAPGSYQVRIREQRRTGKKVPSVPPDTMIDEVIDGIPARYQAKGALQAELAPGDNKVDFDLKSK